MKCWQKILVAILALMFIATLTDLQPLNSQTTSKQITIASDGSVIGTDSIVKKDTVYTLTENLMASIVVLKDNIIIDGAGFTLQGSGIVTDDGVSSLFYQGPETEKAIEMNGRSNVTIGNLSITHFGIGVALYDCSFCVISDNRFNELNGSPSVIYLHNSANNWVTRNVVETFRSNGISIRDSSNNIISRNLVQNSSNNGIIIGGFNNLVAANIIKNTPTGIAVDAVNCSIISNNITRHSFAISLWHAKETKIANNYISRCQISIENDLTGNNNNFVYENEFVNNEFIVEFAQNITFYGNNFVDTYAPMRNAIHSIYPTENITSHTWDNGKTGNYWSDYKTKYSNAKEVGSTGTYDIAYYVSAKPAALNPYAYYDYYPLVHPVTYLKNISDTPSWLLNPQSTTNAQLPQWVILFTAGAIAAILTSIAILLIYTRYGKKTEKKKFEKAL
jgi:parallel beta-helix repeat protein